MTNFGTTFVTVASIGYLVMVGAFAVSLERRLFGIASILRVLG